MTSGERIDVSVIIVTRNTCALTSTAVKSVVESQDKLNKEVVVVDNGSTDDTQSVLRREWPAITIIRSETNLGFARANNLGASKATGEFLLLLNSDARLKPETLKRAHDWMREHPTCGIAGAQLLNPDSSRQNSIANFPSLATELLNKSLLRRIFPNRFPGKERGFTEPVEVESVIGAFMLVRRKIWDEVGGLDERFFFFFEETDFCLQARQRGWKVFHLPQAEVWHEQGKSAGQMAAAARIEYWRSRYTYFRKNHNAFTRGLLRVGLAVRLTGDWIASMVLVELKMGSSVRWRNKLKVNAALMRWHLGGCSARTGLPR